MEEYLNVEKNDFLILNMCQRLEFLNYINEFNVDIYFLGVRYIIYYDLIKI